MDTFSILGRFVSHGNSVYIHPYLNVLPSTRQFNAPSYGKPWMNSHSPNRGRSSSTDNSAHQTNSQNVPRQKNPLFDKSRFKTIQNTGRSQHKATTEKVPTYKTIQEKAFDFGKNVAESLNNAPSDHLQGIRDRLQAKLTQQENLRTYYGQPKQNINTESLLYKAQEGNEDSFASEYRAGQKGTHESFGTKNEYHFSRGLTTNLRKEQSPSQRLSEQDRTALKKDIVATHLQLRSNIRADTKNVGFNDGKEIMQHSTGANRGLFGPSGKKHNTNDRDTQNAIISSTNSSFLGKSTLDKFEEMPNHIGAITSKRFMAPSGAIGQNTTTTNSQTINHQMKQREYIKMNAHLGTTDFSQIATQDRSNKFKRNKTLGTTVSPRRTGISDHSPNQK